MTDQKLHLKIVSQERELVSADVNQITAPSSDGEITILPGHIPLMSQLQGGELRYVSDKESDVIVISRGFINVAPDNEVTVIVDTAKYVRELSEDLAEAAVQAAQETMKQTTNQRELIMAEASLRQALLELRIAQKTKKSRI